MCKKIVFFLLLVTAMVSANAQFRKVPAEVTEAFRVKYANASHVSWKDKFSSFQADYKVGEINMKSIFNSKGEWLKTETKYSFETLPDEVKDGFKKSKYADMNVSDVIQVEEKDKVTEYRMVVKKGDLSKKNLVFARTGQLLRDGGIL